MNLAVHLFCGFRNPLTPTKGLCVTQYSTINISSDRLPENACSYLWWVAFTSCVAVLRNARPCSPLSLCFFLQLQQQQSRLMKINHDLRHKISVVEAQGKALIEQKVELEASAQARGQEVAALRQEAARLRERLQGELPAQNPDEPPPQPPSPAEVTAQGKLSITFCFHVFVFCTDNIAYFNVDLLHKLYIA